MFDPMDYTTTVLRIDGNTFRGIVLELPDLEEFAESWDETYDLVLDSITTAYKAHQEQGGEFPKPLKE